MSSPGIENPKVFISYAWGSKEYQEKVIALARDLMRDGIEVVLDKWSLKEGNDTYAFMEKSVTDSEITNVLILLDPEYEIKANERSGGVGTETQIISPAIYNKVNQEKFLPIIFERGLEGEVPKPAYLKGLLHFDLSKEENYDDEYERLAKRLYGVEIVKKPEIGSRPAWIDSTTTINTKVRNKFSALRNNLPHKAKIEQFELFLSDFKNRFIHFKKDETVEKLEHKDYIALYAETKSLRDEFLHLLSYIPFVDTGEKLVASKLEEVCEDLKGRGGYVNEIQKTLLHEIFIYLIAIYYKSKNYAAISYTLTKTYFVSDYYKGNAQSFNIFYYLNQNFDNAVQHQDGKKYYSGTAQYWMNNINTDVCSKNDLVFADSLCYNVAMFIDNYKNPWLWFPLLYVYGGYENQLMRRFAITLQSIEHLENAATIFGYERVEDFKKRFKEIENSIANKVTQVHRYSSSFDDAPILCQYIKYDELGLRN